MRIDKVVDQICKQIGQGVVAYNTGITIKDYEWEEWFYDAIDEVSTYPELDAIAATYGLRADDVLDRLRIVGIIESGPIVGIKEPAEYETHGAYNPDTKELKLFVVEHEVYHDDKHPLMMSFMHEFEHAARDIAIGLGDPDYINEFGFHRAWRQITSPTEITARKAQMFDLLASGYTDEQIITEMLDETLEGQPDSIPAEDRHWQVFRTMMEHQFWDILRQAKEEYAEFL
jgi:hypothetical protein